MAKILSAAAREAATSSVTQTGSEHTTRGAGRPAFRAAAVMAGTM